MNLIESRIAITWYDGVWPSESGAMVLLGADEYIAETSPLLSSVEQLVQRADFHRAESPAFWPRGSKTTSLEWDRVRPALRHDAALVMAMESAEALPTGPGWVAIELVDYGRTWIITDAACRRIESAYDARALRIAQRYILDMGPAVEIATTAEDDAMTWSIGTEMLWESGEYMAYETTP